MSEVQRKRLGDLFTFKNGRAFKKEEWSQTGLPIIRIQNLNNPEAPFNYFSGEYGADILVESGDLLFSWSGTVGTSFGSHLWKRENGVLNQHIFKVGLRDGIAKRYAFHALRHITREIEEAVNGAVGLAHITKEKLNEFTIPLPPLAEQQRIVGVLDEAFAGLATAKATAKKNLQNARALFESHLQSVFTHRGPDWVETTVGKLVQQGVLDAPIDGNHGEIHPKKADFVEVGVPFLMASDLKNGLVDQENCVFISRKQAESLRKGFAKHGDVLLSHKGTIGRVAILHTDHDYVVLTPQVTYYRIAKPAVLSNHFLFYALQAEEFVSAMNEIAGAGSTRAYIGITKQHELPLMFPPLDQQRQFASQLDSLSAETQRLAALYERKLAALEELKKSLLHQAFTGQL